MDFLGIVKVSNWRRFQYALLLFLGLSLVFTLQSPCLATADPAVTTQPAARERERQLRQQQEQIPDVQLQPQPLPEVNQRLPAEESPSFLIQQLQLQGEASEQFQWALRGAHYAGKHLDSPLGRHLGAQGIELLLKRVQNAIVQRGWITTQVILKPQNLQKGMLVFTLVPGRLHRLYFTEDSDSRASFRNLLPLQPGAILNLRAIEPALESSRRLQATEKTAHCQR